MNRLLLGKLWASQKLRFAAAGLGVAAVLTLGLLLVRCACRLGTVAPWAWLAELRAEPVTYAYLGCATCSVAVALGLFWGAQADRFEQLSLTDTLTGLCNRRAFSQCLHDELLRASRYEAALTVLILDLDNLKVVNDLHGHEAGDRALRLVAESLRSSSRATDFVARLGGDEFVVVAPSTTASESLELASRVRHRLSVLSQDAPLTLSVGIADLNCVAASSCRSEALMSAADAALYRAKSAGRDRAVLARAMQGGKAQGQAVA